MRKITASTQLYGIFGNPARHSKSPILHNGWFDDCGIDATYIAFEPLIEEFEIAFSGLVAAGLKGCNITAPFKEAAAKISNFKTHDIEIMGAANTIKIDNSKSHAFNTDGYGLILDLDKRAQNWRENHEKIAIIGAGGAAKGVIDAFIKNGTKQFNIIARNQEKLDEIINCSKILENINCHFNGILWDEIENGVEDCGLIINATTIGLNNIGELKFDLSKSKSQAIIYDMVYHPSETSFRKMAQDQNRQNLNGIGMLVGQAVLAFEKWFDIRPDFEIGLKRVLENA